MDHFTRRHTASEECKLGGVQSRAQPEVEHVGTRFDILLSLRDLLTEIPASPGR
jgi:hypothetical protein